MFHRKYFVKSAIVFNSLYCRRFPAAKCIILFLLISAFALGCRSPSGQFAQGMQHMTTGKNTTGSYSQEITMPVDSLDSVYRNVAVQQVRDFYQKRENRLLWISSLHGVSTMDSLIAFIENVRYFGLMSDDYHIIEIRTLKDKLHFAKNVCRLEALLTDAYLGMARNIYYGKTTRSTEQADSVTKLSLEGYAHGGELKTCILLGEPSFAGYRSLRRGLEQLIDSLPPDLRLDVLSNSPRVPKDLRNKIRIIEINLERWRLEKVAYGSRYIFVNIPAFMLYVVENDSVILESRIVVGTPKTPTPVLSSMVECIVTYPYWLVPRKIAVEEYLPVIQSDSMFIRRNNFDVLDRKGNLLNPDSLDWERFNRNNFPVSLRQREGADNALGVIKFLFDNPYSVFLHDTNAKRLFMRTARAFSHGCIRLDKAVELAHYLVTRDVNRKSSDVARYLKEARRRSIELQNPIPIFVRYYTCDYDNSELRFYSDIYGKDRSIGAHFK